MMKRPPIQHRVTKDGIRDPVRRIQARDASMAGNIYSHHGDRKPTFIKRSEQRVLNPIGLRLHRIEHNCFGDLIFVNPPAFFRVEATRIVTAEKPFLEGRQPVRE